MFEMFYWPKGAPGIKHKFIGKIEGIFINSRLVKVYFFVQEREIIIRLDFYVLDNTKSFYDAERRGELQGSRNGNVKGFKGVLRVSGGVSLVFLKF